MSNRWRSSKELQAHLGSNVYGGQSKAARHIMPLLPKGDVIVEPFAGHGHVSVMAIKEGKFGKAVLGDKNCQALSWVKKYRNTEKIITKCQDWKDTIRQNDSKDAVFLFDPPWKSADQCYTAYKGNCTNFAPQIMQMSSKMKGKSVLLLGDTPEHRKLACNRKSKFKCKTITVDSRIFGAKSEWKEIVAVKK